MKQINYTGRNSLPGDLAVWDGHVAMVVGGNGMMISGPDVNGVLVNGTSRTPKIFINSAGKLHCRVTVLES